MPQLCFLHGFLGCPEDWEEVVSELGYGLPLSYPFEVPQDAILVGYSMGGRIALKYPNPKVIISAHLGLDQGHEERKAEEEKWILLLKTLPFPGFLEIWYEQPLFDSLRAHPNFSQILARRLKQDPSQALHQLCHHRLSEQPKFSPSPNDLFLYGETDFKYKKPYSIPIERSGHACHLENPQACAHIIQDFVERVENLHRHQVP
jgi:2-succinyl-6-hydroxy-2,4-cyclohexadiene-1-carboxylate synthase